jgi:hypothetical protein
MASSTSPTSLKSPLFRLWFWPVAACAVSTGVVCAAALLGPGGWSAAAALAGAAVMVGTLAGAAALALLAGSSAGDVSFLVLGVSVLRATAAVLAGLLARGAAGADARAFWVSFLLVMGCVMAAEVWAAARVLAGEAPGRDVPSKEVRQA